MKFFFFFFQWQLVKLLHLVFRIWFAKLSFVSQISFMVCLLVNNPLLHSVLGCKFIFKAANMQNLHFVALKYNFWSLDCFFCCVFFFFLHLLHCTDCLQLRDAQYICTIYLHRLTMVDINFDIHMHPGVWQTYVWLVAEVSCSSCVSARLFFCSCFSFLQWFCLLTAGVQQ